MIIEIGVSLESTMARAAYAYLDANQKHLAGVSPDHLATAEKLAATTSNKPLMLLCVQARRARKRSEAVSRRDDRLTRIVNLKLKGSSPSELDEIFDEVAVDEQEIESIQSGDADQVTPEAPTDEAKNNRKGRSK